jgi:hypothetical protein
MGKVVDDAHVSSGAAGYDPLMLGLVLLLLAFGSQDPLREERQAMLHNLQLVRQRQRPLAEREQAVQALLALSLPEAGAKLAEALEREAELVAKEVARARADLVDGFAKKARILVEHRMNREAQSRLGELRELLLETSRAESLDHAAIESVCDPTLKQLEQLLTVKLNDVWDANEDLFAELDRLLLRMEDAKQLHAWRVKSAERLEQEPPPAPAATEDELYGALEREAWLVTPMSERDHAVWLANEGLATSIDREEYLGVVRLNEIRVLCGLPVQAIDLKLCTAARGHSKDMVELGFFSHDSPVPGKSTPWARAEQAGTSASAENIAAGASTGAAAITMWWYSPGHHKNMLGGGSRVGLGRHETHWTQLFGD